MGSDSRMSTSKNGGDNPPDMSSTTNDGVRESTEHEHEHKHKHEHEHVQPSRDDTAIFENFGWDTTPDIERTVKGLLTSRPVLAEFFATTLFVWIGCGAAVSSQAMVGFNPDDARSNTFLLGVAIAFGFAITVLAYTIAPISGGHINPAVTFAFLILGEIDIATACTYMVAQCLGALLGASIVWGSMVAEPLSLATDPDSFDAPPFFLGANSLSPGYAVGSAFLIECMGTFLLVWTVLLTAASKMNIAGNLAPIAIGWSVMLAHLVLIPFTGCGINPARSLGPHLVVSMAGYNPWTRGTWVYYTAPFVGAAAAALVTKYIFGVRNRGNMETEAVDNSDQEQEQEQEQAKDEIKEDDKVVDIDTAA